MDNIAMVVALIKKFGGGGGVSYATESEVTDMLLELDAAPLLLDADGAIMTDESGAMLLI